MRRVALLLLALVILGAVAVAVTVGEVHRRWQEPLPIPADGYLFTIEQGDSLRVVADNLHRAGIVQYPRLLSLYGQWTGVDQQIKRGEYRFPPGLTGQSLLDFLERGEVIQYQVTLPEGITLAAALAILAQQEALETVLSGPDDPRIQELIAPHEVPEGLFFPDSYRFARGDTDWSILRRAHATMASVLQEEWEQREMELPYDNPYEALIMASIIERETGMKGERGQISGVFARRLDKGMLLQTDPTVIYGLGPEFDGNLRRKHLEEGENVYNTYRHSGLPPTPIALPGRASIHAALHPEAGTALYFVARGDGGHVFSDTLRDHNRAVREYQLKRREDYRSSPEVPQ